MDKAADTVFRGTIIVDNSSLDNLCESINLGFLDKDLESGKVCHYLELLEFLAGQGYRVLIPEMIALEASSVLASGQSLMEYFPRARIYGRGGHYLEDFLQRAAREEIPNIEILPVEGPPRVKEYIDGLHRAIKAHPFPSAAARNAISDARAVVDKTGFGDDAIEDLASRLFNRNNKNKPVFVLTEDKKLIYDLRKHRVHAINTRGLLSAFVLSNLHTEIGIKENVKPTELANNCKKDSLAHIIDTTSEHYGAFYKLHCEIPYSDQKKYFLGNMLRLAKTLGIKEKLYKRHEQEAAEPPTPHMDRVAWFRKRFEKGTNNDDEKSKGRNAS